MKFEFFDTTIGDQLTLQRGFDISKKEQSPGNVPVVSSGGISSYHNEAKVRGPGVVLGRKGSLGTVFFVKDDYWPHSTSLWVKDFKDNNPRFVYYFFKNITDELKKMDVGAANPSLNRNHVHPMEIRWPKRKQQDYIVEVLSKIDDKIELNRQTNQTLEQIAQAIFKSWFVDFDPVKAKIAAKENGQNPERAAMAALSGKALEELEELSQETLQQLKTTAALFPDALVESELGEIPEGWRVSDLKSCSIEIRRGISPNYTESNGIQVVNQKCIRNHLINFELTRLNDPIKRNVDGRYIEMGDILINSTGVGTLGRLAPVIYLPEPTVFDSHLTVVRADTTKISKTFLSGLMLEKETFIEASGAGSTGQTELRKQVIEEIRFAKPSIDLGQLFETIVEPMNKHIAVSEQQQKVLAELRDALLPKLLSGELNVQKDVV